MLKAIRSIVVGAIATAPFVFAAIAIYGDIPHGLWFLGVAAGGFGFAAIQFVDEVF